MGYMTIDGRKVEFTDEPNVLSVIRNADIDIPTLCYHSELSVYGACRLCTVEDERGKTFASCSEPPRDGMVIYTNTPRLMKYRKMILELLLAAHCRDCTTCIKSGECQLQALAHRMGVTTVRFENTKEQYPLDFSSPSIVRDPNKCILCGDCVRMCDNVQSVNAIDFAYRGTKALVTPAFNKKIAETDCVNCGQCRVVCPTGAISINTNIEVIWDLLADKNTKVIAQIAPAVRVAVGDQFGLQRGENVMGKLVNVLHRLGFDEVYDRFRNSLCDLLSFNHLIIKSGNRVNRLYCMWFFGWNHVAWNNQYFLKNFSNRWNGYVFSSCHGRRFRWQHWTWNCWSYHPECWK